MKHDLSTRQFDVQIEDALVSGSISRRLAYEIQYKTCSEVLQCGATYSTDAPSPNGSLSPSPLLPGNEPVAVSPDSSTISSHFLFSKQHEPRCFISVKHEELTLDSEKRLNTPSAGKHRRCRSSVFPFGLRSRSTLRVDLSVQIDELVGWLCISSQVTIE